MATAARAFVVAALVGPLLWGPATATATVVSLAAAASIWTLVSVVEWRLGTSPLLVSITESGAIGVICGSLLDTTLGFLAALAVAPFTAALFHTVRGVVASLLAELTGLVAAAAAMNGPLTAEQGAGVFSWLMTGLGLGLIGTFLHGALSQRDDALAPYLSAQSLLRQLIDLSEDLDSGLDAVTLGGEALELVADRIPCGALVLQVPRHDELTPLLTHTIDHGADLSHSAHLAVEAWSLDKPVVGGHGFAFPMRSESGTTAIVAGVLSERMAPVTVDLDNHLRRLMVDLRTTSVHLDTALMFAAFRDAATDRERKRLGREIHDGIAQEIASLGYVVDALAATSPADQAERLSMLRDRITSVVSEIRRSVETLRTSVGSSESLGAAIGAIARNLTEVSGVPIHVTLDETTERLRPEVEGELFRICQEAMNNAVKHAEATEITVHCRVHPPSA
ncbi:MAG: sensor histidine kinase, partial [Nocardioides sp.]